MIDKQVPSSTIVNLESGPTLKKASSNSSTHKQLSSSQEEGIYPSGQNLKDSNGSNSGAKKSFLSRMAGSNTSISNKLYWHFKTYKCN